MNLAIPLERPSLFIYYAIYRRKLVFLMSYSQASSSTLAGVRKSINQLPPSRTRLLFVQAVFLPEKGYYVEEIRIDDFEQYSHGESRRKSVFHSGLLITSRMGTKYYKNSESLKTDLARLFSKDDVPNCIDIRIVNWSSAFPDALADSEPDGDG